jgi:protein TonB
VKKIGALFLSLFIHLAVPVAIYFIYNGRGVAPDAEAVAEAPIGDVFVQEATPGESAPQTAEAMSLPEEAKKPGLESSSSPGLPDGEASALGKIQPTYPALSRKLGEEGEASFLIDIATDGTVTNVRLDRSSGHERLDEAARTALSAARFQPAVKGGVPAPSTKRLSVDFRLQGQSR